MASTDDNTGVGGGAQERTSSCWSRARLSPSRSGSAPGKKRPVVRTCDSDRVSESSSGPVTRRSFPRTLFRAPSVRAGYLCTVAAAHSFVTRCVRYNRRRHAGYALARIVAPSHARPGVVGRRSVEDTMR